MEEYDMTFASSLLLIAVGAILRFAVSVSTTGVNLHTVGVILMIVGGVGFLLSLFWTAVAAERSPNASPGSDLGRNVPSTERPRY
jgi:hypothetical protein